MSSEQVVFLGVARAMHSKHLLLASVFPPGKPSTDTKSLIERHFVTVSSCEHQISGYTSKASIRTYYCYILYDEALACFLCAAAPHTFSERLAWDVVRAAREEVANLPRDELDNARPLGLNKALREPFRNLMSGHKSDELSNAQNAVENVKSHMTANMAKMTTNMQDISDLETRAGDLERGTNTYVMNSSELKSMAVSSSRKWTFAMGAILLLSVLLFLKIVHAF